MTSLYNSDLAKWIGVEKPAAGLVPWSWDTQNMVGHVMDLMALNCEECKYYRNKPVMCAYIRGYYGGKYPQAAAPEAWQVSPEGVPICKDFRTDCGGSILNIGTDPHKVPKPPTNNIEINKKVLVFDTENNKLFCIETTEIEKFQKNNFIIKPLKNKVLAHLLETIYK